MGLYRTRTLSWMISYMFLISVCCAALDECKKVDDCSCKLPDGKEIDIRSLGYKGTSAPRFKYQLSGSWNYAYNPCYPWSDTSACQNVAACQKGTAPPIERFAIGSATPATWKIEKNNYVVEYSTVAGGHTRTSVVKLTCDQAKTDPALAAQGSRTDPKFPDTTFYDFELTSKCCCPGGCASVTPTKHSPSSGGISVGSVLCIIVAVLIVVYLIGGVLFMKFVRHAEGREIIPNSDIWAGLPGNIRDGFMFVFTCGKNSGYDTMK